LSIKYAILIHKILTTFSQDIHNIIG